MKRPKKDKLKQKLWDAVNEHVSISQDEQQLSPLGKAIYIEALGGSEDNNIQRDDVIGYIEKLILDLESVVRDLE